MTAPNRSKEAMSWRDRLVVGGSAFGLWLILSGRLDAAHLAIGALASAGLAAAYRPSVPGRRFPTARFVGFLPWLLWQVVVSNLRVARLVLTPGRRIAPSLVDRFVHADDERALALLGCAITLTPGTLTIEVEPGRILVHALDDASARDVREDRMARRVLGLFPREASA